MSENHKLILARKSMLDDQLEKLKNQMTGRDNSFYPFITNSFGEISERKLSSFIKELTDKPQKYTNSDSFYLSGYDVGSSYKKLCKCFLYCAIQGISSYNSEYFYPESTAMLFSDIVKLAEYKNNTYFKNEKVLFEHEFNNSMCEGKYIYSQELEHSLFHYCNALYSLLTGESITEIIPKDIYTEMLNRYLDKQAKDQGFDSAEEYENAQLNDEAFREEDWEDYLASLDENERAEIEAANEAYANMLTETDDRHQKGMEIFREKYLKNIVSPEKYVKNYLDFRKLFFALPEYKRRYVFDDIILMIDVFLYEHGLSPMTNNDIYAEFDDHTDRLYAMMKRKPIKRGE